MTAALTMKPESSASPPAAFSSRSAAVHPGSEALISDSESSGFRFPTVPFDFAIQWISISNPVLPVQKHCFWIRNPLNSGFNPVDSTLESSEFWPEALCWDPESSGFRRRDECFETGIQWSPVSIDVEPAQEH